MRLCVPVCSLLAVLALAQPTFSRTWHILPDGSGDAPTIQAGIDSAAAGDVVVLGAGTYYEHDILLKSQVDVRSSSLDPTDTTIDAEGLGRIFGAYSVECTLTGIGIAHGYAPWGAGIDSRDSDLTIEDCLFTENHVGPEGYTGGGAILAWDGPVRCRRCSFIANSAHWSGGAALAYSAAPMTFEYCLFAFNRTNRSGGAFCGYGGSGERYVLLNCTFVGNRAPAGEAAAIGLWYNMTATLDNCIIVFSSEGQAVHCRGQGLPVVRCCNIFGNAGGDWVGCIEGLLPTNENFSAWPRFCDSSSNNYFLAADSPCLNHGTCGEFIGAFGQGCGPVALTPQTWARVKARYR
jgi:hypothetical protein